MHDYKLIEVILIISGLLQLVASFFLIKGAKKRIKALKEDLASKGITAEFKEPIQEPK